MIRTILQISLLYFFHILARFIWFRIFIVRNNVYFISFCLFFSLFTIFLRKFFSNVIFHFFRFLNFNFIKFYVFFCLFFKKMSKKTVFFDVVISSRNTKKQKSKKITRRSFLTRQFFDDFERIDLIQFIINDDLVRKIFCRFFFFCILCCNVWSTFLRDWFVIF